MGDPVEPRLASGVVVDVRQTDFGMDDVLEVSGSLLDGVDGQWTPDYDSWLSVERARTESRLIGALHHGAETAMARNDLVQATVAAREMARRAPIDESGYVMLVHALTRAGDTSAAVDVTRACEELFVAELGVAPAAALSDAARPSDRTGRTHVSPTASVRAFLESGSAALDAGAIDDCWRVTMSPDGIPTVRYDGPAEVTERGPASDVYLVLWNRGDDTVVDVAGARDAARPVRPSSADRGAGGRGRTRSLTWMRDRARRAGTRAVRSVVGFAAARVAASDRLMDVVYDLMNETNFSGLAEHEEMLSDAVRLHAYHRAIRRNVGPGDVVLDLGTGTGLLAFLASRAGARKVYAVEHSDFIEVAEEIARLNDFTNIAFVQANSREYTPPEPVDVVLHEQMGDELFNENMLQNVLDLRDRVLRPGGRILPARFRLYVEPVAMHEAMRVRRFWNIELPEGIDLGPMERSPVAARFDTGRNEQLWVRPGSVASTVGEPDPLLEVDLQTLGSVDELPVDHVVERTAATDAIVDGACVWFEAVFDDETTLTTSPLATNTSWGNRLFRLDREVDAGETLRLHVHLSQLVDASTWTVRVI